MERKSMWESLRVRKWAQAREWRWERMSARKGISKREESRGEERWVIARKQEGKRGTVWAEANMSRVWESEKVSKHKSESASKSTKALEWEKVLECKWESESKKMRMSNSGKSSTSMWARGESEHEREQEWLTARERLRGSESERRMGAKERWSETVLEKRHEMERKQEIKCQRNWESKKVREQEN